MRWCVNYIKPRPLARDTKASRRLQEDTDILKHSACQSEEEDDSGPQNTVTLALQRDMPEDLRPDERGYERAQQVQL